MKSLDDLMKMVYSRKAESVWVHTEGRNQTGKTDWNLRQFEMIKRLGLGDVFATNIETVECDWIEKIYDFDTLEKRCKMLNVNPRKYGLKRVFFLISELADFVPRDQPWSNVEFIKKLQKVRKYGLCVLSDAIDRVDERVLNPTHFHGKFKKLSKKDPTRAKYYDWTTGRVFPVYDIPRTTIPFDTYDSSSFYMKPQVPEESIVPLNESHKIVKEYMRTKSWKKTGVTTQQGKRELFKVLEYHFTHCLPSVSEPVKEKPVSEIASPV